MKNAIMVAIILLGTLIGVGFASGKEIVTFFARFGLWGVLMVLIAGLLFTFTIYFSMKKFDKNENAIAEKCFKYFFILCSFIVMSAMMAGVFDIDRNFGNGRVYLSVGLIILCFILVVFGLTSIEKINKFFVPIVIVSIIFIGLYCFTNSGKFELVVGHNENALSAFGFMGMYVGMNILTISPLASVLKGKLTTEREVKLCSGIFGIGVSLILIVSVLLLMRFGDFETSMPILEIAMNISPIIGLIYKALIIMGLITTLISSAFIVKNEIMKFVRNNFIATAITFILGFALSILGFSNIINFVYPLIGVGGIIYVCYEILSGIIKMRKLKHAKI